VLTAGGYVAIGARVDEIGKILGKEQTEKAISEAYEEAAQFFDANHWIVFRYGTSEEGGS
jgi:hypothetical protein